MIQSWNKTKKGDVDRPFFLIACIQVGVLCSSLIPATVSAAEWGPYVEIDTFTYSEVMSIKGFIDHFSGELQSGSKAVTHNRAEAGVHYDQWWLAKVVRYDYEIAFSPDTALLNYQIENNLPIDETRSYEIYLKAQHLRSTGFTLGRYFQPRSNVRWGIGLSWLSSEQFYDGYIQASVDQGTIRAFDLATFDSLIADLQDIEVTSASQVIALGESLRPVIAQLQQQIASTQLSGSADYFYYKPALREDEISAFDQVDFSAPTGRGYTLDLLVDWQIAPKWQMGMRIRDAYSQIRWQNAPGTTVSVDVTQAALDVVEVLEQFIEEDVIKRASGQFYQPINPADPGNPLGAIPALQQRILDERYRANVRNQDYTQRLPPQILVSTRYQVLPYVELGAGWLETDVESFPHARVQFFQHYWLHYEWAAQAYGIGFDSKYFKFGITADSTDINEAKFLSANLSANIYF
jgi:hypothetical protein